MLSKEEIVTRLRKLKFQDEEIDGVISDVGQVIIGKSLVSYLSSLPDAERSKLESLPGEELVQFLVSQKGVLPNFPNEEFLRIHDQTWDDYFDSFSK